MRMQKPNGCIASSVVITCSGMSKDRHDGENHRYVEALIRSIEEFGKLSVTWLSSTKLLEHDHPN